MEKFNAYWGLDPQEEKNDMENLIGKRVKITTLPFQGNCSLGDAGEVVGVSSVSGGARSAIMVRVDGISKPCEFYRPDSFEIIPDPIYFCFGCNAVMSHGGVHRVGCGKPSDIQPHKEALLKALGVG